MVISASHERIYEWSCYFGVVSGDYCQEGSQQISRQGRTHSSWQDTNMPSKTLVSVRYRVFACCQAPLCSCSTFQHSHRWLSSRGISLGSLASLPAEGSGKGLWYLSSSPSVRELDVLSWAAASVLFCRSGRGVPVVVSSRGYGNRLAKRGWCSCEVALCWSGAHAKVPGDVRVRRPRTLFKWLLPLMLSCRVTVTCALELPNSCVLQVPMCSVVHV